MLQLSQYIVNTIIRNIRTKEQKNLFRVDGYEDLRVYAHVCKGISQYCDESGITLVAKIAKTKFERLSMDYQAEYEANYMKNSRFVDEENHMTSYRNTVPAENERVVILLMGTDEVDDKGGLNDFFVIDPAYIDRKVGNNYAAIMSKELKAKFDNPDDVAKIVNNFCKELFSAVPKDLFKISCQMDRWLSIQRSEEEVVEELYGSLPGWGIPKIYDITQAVSVNSYVLNTHPRILTKAYEFITGKTYDNSKRTLDKIRNTFAKYCEKPGKYATDYPNDQRVSSIEALKSTVLRFVSGHTDSDTISGLMHTDFSILYDILSFKTKKDPPPAKSKPISGDPQKVLYSTLLNAISSKKETVDHITFSFDRATVTGIPRGLEANERKARIINAWQRVTYFAGGIFDFINEENWQNNAGTIVDIEFLTGTETMNFFSPSNAEKLLEKGILTSESSGSGNYKIEFSVTATNCGEDVYVQDYVWGFSPNDDWVVAFELFDEMPNLNSYVPYAVIKNINEAYFLKDATGFEFWLDSVQTNFLFDDEDIIKAVKTQLHLEEDNEEISHLYRLGQVFQAFRQDVMKNGFFTTIKTSAVKFMDEAVSIYKRVQNKTAYTGKLKLLQTAIIYLFSITKETDVQYKSGRTHQVIVPPYHPATIEKMVDRMLFVRAGMKEWNKDTNTNSTAESRIATLLSLSSIQSSTDAFPVSPVTMQPFRRTFGYYTLYGNPEENTEFTSSQTIMKKEAVLEDDFKEDELRTVSSESKLILRVIKNYVKTYTSARNNLSIAIINPTDLQIVISAIYQFAIERKAEIEKNDNDGNNSLAITLTVITNNESHGDRTYLAYWINNSFSADENIDVKAYLKVYANENEIPRLFDAPMDLTIWFDALNTNRKATYKFDRAAFAPERLLDCRFPMVFKPAITMRNYNEHKIGITQPQFRVATEHTQVLRVFSDAQSENRYNLVQSSEMDKDRGNVIRETQKKTIWLVCIDNAMDKRAVRELYAYDTGIIGFTTGEGSYGQINMAITCHGDVISDMKPRCEARLKKIFRSKWTDNELKIAAKNCIDKARKLDGVSILKAMNLYDYEMNNYLAYLIADAITEPTKKTLHVLIRLDSYTHWFDKNSIKDEDKMIPDFLLLDADIQENGKLHFYAKVIESKISSLFGIDGHIEKAEKQISYGMKKLKQHFNPNDKSVERRYWLAQLYRAIAFLQADSDYDEFVFSEITKQMNKMLEEGDYEIEWSAMILANIVDSNTYVNISKYTSFAGDEIELWKLGQLSMQNILLNRDIEETGVEFDDTASIEDDATVAETANDESKQDDNEEVPAIEGSITPIHLGGGLNMNEKEEVNEHQPEVTPEEEKQGENINEEEMQEHSEDSQGSTEETIVETPEATEEPAVGDIQNIRVLIGTDKRNNNVYWEYGNPKLANRHILITGGSGQGKTYAIETFLSELAKQNISSVIFDYTDGFLMEHLEKPFKDQLGDRIDERIAIASGIPVNPFKLREIKIGGQLIPERSTQAAGRLSAIMKHVYGFGDQQASAIYSACKTGIDKYKEQMDFNKLRELLKAEGTQVSKTVLSKTQQFFDMDLFDVHDGFDWHNITAGGGKVTIIQLTQLDREMQTAITEMLLWDAWYSIQTLGEKNTPFVVVLDEAQNLSFAEGSPAQKILQEGRKFGWSAWFATQFLKGAMTSDEISRLQQAAETLYFKPSSEETASIAQMLSDQTHSQGDWIETLKKLQKGHCVVKADRIGSNGVFGSYPPVVVKVSSFEDRA